MNQSIKLPSHDEFNLLSKYPLLQRQNGIGDFRPSSSLTIIGESNTSFACNFCSIFCILCPFNIKQVAFESSQ